MRLLNEKILNEMLEFTRYEISNANAVLFFTNKMYVYLSDILFNFFFDLSRNKVLINLSLTYSYYFKILI